MDNKYKQVRVMSLDLADRYAFGPIKDRRTGRRTRPCHTPNRTVRKKILKKVKKK